VPPCREIDDGADGAEEDDDVQPEAIGPAADEVDDRKSLNQEGPRVKVAQQSHGFGALRSLWE